MIVREILDLARGICGDTRQPYLWPPSEMLQYYNRAVDEVCRRVKHIRDSSTASICEIRVLAGIHTYAYSPKIIEVLAAKLQTQHHPLDHKSEYEMNRDYAGWKISTGTPRVFIPEIERGKFRLCPYFEGTYVVEGSSNISFVAATKTISKPSGLSIFSQGDKISVSGTTNNNSVFTVSTVSDTAITVNENLVEEPDTSAIIRRVEDLLELSVARLPLTWVTMANHETEEPPMDEDFQVDLVHGILSYAYLKEGTETFDSRASADRKLRFEEMLGKFKKAQLGKTHNHPQTIRPHRGAI